MKKRVFQKESGQKQRKKRMALLALFFLFSFSILVYRCLYLHLATDSKLEKIAHTQYRTKLQESPPRGNIYDASGEELAISVPTYSLAARPPQIKEREKTISDLAAILHLSRPELDAKLDPHKKYVWVKRYLPPVEKDQVSELTRLSSSGIELVKEAKRFYPNREVASQILGAVGADNEGLGGLEFFYDRYLRGSQDQSTAFRDARGKTFETEETLAQGKEDPHHLTLTIRKDIQYVTESELNAACKQYRAKSCTAVVMEPETGAILAMASFPTFNPNSYQSYDIGLWRNVAVTDTFEPGSTFKTIMAASALEGGAVKPDDRFFCENGALKIGQHLIHDHDPHGLLSFRDIVKVSSNIGIYKVGRKVGRKGFAEIISRFGFGQKTGIDYPGEVAGYVPPLASWQEIEFANLSFGQGVRVTPLQLASSFATIANGGIRMRPYLVSRVTDAEGKTILEVAPRPLGRALREETARGLIEILKEVTEEGGTATKAALPGYTVAGKTGTAQKVVHGEYSHTKFMSSFVGIVPADHPRLVVLVIMDEPQGVVYGGLVAAPIFKKIAWASLMDLGVPPEKQVVPIVREAGLMEQPFKQRPMAEGIREIPDFRGFSKRKVLALLEAEGLEGQVIGSGIAVSQDPPPGTPLKKGEACRIFFRPD